MKRITKQQIKRFQFYLIRQEKSSATLKKYLRDVRAFSEWLDGACPEKEGVLHYKQYLISHYAPASVNSILSSLNCFFCFMEWHELKVKAVKIQKQIFAEKNKELTKAEYEKLLRAANRKHNRRLYYLMQTICSCGLRVSELQFITTDAVQTGQATINCKGKIRVVILPKQLCKMLGNYMKECNIKSGPVFVSKTGKPLDRSNIWLDMKKLCESAGVPKEKVFPHNLRHLFARTYYSVQKDVVRLADILGHSNINTTRIYTLESGEIHRKQIQKLGLLWGHSQITT